MGRQTFFQGNWRFLTTGQEFEGNVLLLFKGWDLGSLLGKRIPDQMLSISQSIPGRVTEMEKDAAEVCHKLGDNGRIYVFRSLDDMNILPK